MGSLPLKANDCALPAPPGKLPRHDGKTVSIHIPEVTNSRYLLRDARAQARTDHIVELENPIVVIAPLESRKIPLIDYPRTPSFNICCM